MIIAQLSSSEHDHCASLNVEYSLPYKAQHVLSSILVYSSNANTYFKLYLTFYKEIITSICISLEEGILCFHFWIIKYSVIITWRNNPWAFLITVATRNLATVLTRTSRGAMTITLTSTLASVIPVTTPSLRTIYNKGLCHVYVGNWNASSFYFLP